MKYLDAKAASGAPENKMRIPQTENKAVQPATPLEPADYEGAWNKDELLAEVERRGLTVRGSGENGRLLKSDLIAALEADDAT